MTINIIDSYLAQDLLVYGALSQRLYQSGNYYLVSLYLHAIYINSSLKGKKMRKYAKSSAFPVRILFGHQFACSINLIFFSIFNGFHMGQFLDLIFHNFTLRLVNFITPKETMYILPTTYGPQKLIRVLKVNYFHPPGKKITTN